MKAILIRRYGGPEVVEYAEIETPKPRAGEVLVRVRAASVNPVDWKICDGSMKYLIRHPFPMILGADLAGEVTEFGEGASRFKTGDQVYAVTPGDLGAQAEYVTLPEKLVARKPSNLSPIEAASVPVVALTALQGLRDKAHVKAGQNVLVNGASGGVGMFAVQLAKVLGARVTGVCSGANLDFVRSLGADMVIDYKTTDFTAGTDHYDVVFDAVATKSLAQCERVMNPGGSYITTVPTLAMFLRSLINPLMSHKLVPLLLKPSGEDLDYMRTLLEEGRVKTVIDRTFPLAQAKEAFAYSKTERARGKIVLTVGD